MPPRTIYKIKLCRCVSGILSKITLEIEDYSHAYAVRQALEKLPGWQVYYEE